jgi:hypothetical protein
MLQINIMALVTKSDMLLDSPWDSYLLGQCLPLPIIEFFSTVPSALEGQIAERKTMRF